MKRFGIALAAIVLLAGGAALAYGAIGASPPGVTLTGCLSRSGDIDKIAVGTEPRRKCSKRETQVTLGNGDITAVVAGTGLQGGADSGGATLDIGPGFRLPQTCTGGQTVTVSGNGWGCAERQTVTTQQLAAGDANCPQGGTAILIGLLQPAYACNGAPGQNGTNGKDGAGTLRSPNGLFSITVGNSGIKLKGPRGSFSVGYTGGLKAGDTG